MKFYSLGLLVVLLMTGCSVPEKTTSKPASAKVSSVNNDIRELNLLSMPMALNLDSKPGADGIAVKVFANDATNPKTVPIMKGKLEIFMYDGVVGFDATNIPPPLHIWSYEPSELRAFAFKKTIGTGYDILLVWGQDTPRKNQVTLSARLSDGKGGFIYSGPVTVTVVTM